MTYPNEKDYALLFVFECKNYKGAVSIDNIEEFSSKLSQIGGHNIKGIMVTTSRYSENGLNFARAKGIGLARLSENAFSYDIQRLSRYNTVITHGEEISKALCDEESNTPFYAYDIISTNNILEYLLHLGVIDVIPQKTKLKIPFIKSEVLKKNAENLLKTYVPEVFQIIQPTSLKHICDFISKESSVNFIFNENLGQSCGKEILGKISFNPTCIYVSSTIQNKHRWRFTLAHEIGHYILHLQYLSEHSNSNIDTTESINLNITDKILQRMELQANVFAGHLLMPEYSFIALVKQRFMLDRIKGHKLILDGQYCNICTFHRVISEISHFFDVSKESARYRLQDLNLYEDKTSLHHIKDFF